MTSLTPYNFTQKLGDSYNFELRVEHLKVTLEPHFLPGFLSWKQLQRLVFPLTGLGVELHYASNCEVAWLERTLKSYHTTQKNHDTVMHWCNILMFLDFILPFLDSTYLDTSLPNSGTDCLTTFHHVRSDLAVRTAEEKCISVLSKVVSMGDRELLSDANHTIFTV